MTVLFLTKGSEGFLGLLASSGLERNANVNRSHLNGPVNRKTYGLGWWNEDPLEI